MNHKQLAYLEAKQPPKSQAALVSLVLQHWQNRYLYGKALVIVDDPTSFAKAVRKRWTSLIQTGQSEHSHTFDADRLRLRDPGLSQQDHPRGERPRAPAPAGRRLV